LYCALVLSCLSSLSLHDALPILWALGFVIYNAIMKAMANKTVAAGICLVLYAIVYGILECPKLGHFSGRALYIHAGATFMPRPRDRKSTRLNSSHLGISYAVFCL